MMKIMKDVTDDLLEPPVFPDMQRGVWSALPAGDPVTGHLAAQHWEGDGKPAGWEAARLSGAVYLYREMASGWAAAAKFYKVKVGPSAAEDAEAEMARTQEARAGLSGSEGGRALRPLGVWRGVLFLEYIDGLTLEDMISVRRSRPGALLACVEQTSTLLAALHTHTLCPDEPADFTHPLRKVRKVINNLVSHGVLEDDPLTAAGLRCEVDRWADTPAMRAFTPVLVHGDATTANFVFPWAGGIVGIDWERAKLADPAADLGRLVAEVSHSLKQHGGSVAEAMPDVRYLIDSYCAALPPGWDADALVERARFYWAWSTLRIARNGWVSRLDRTALVAQAFALLSGCDLPC